jgi:hypothetical protein
MLDLAALRHALNKCLDACREQLGEHVDIGADGYWLIEPSAAFDLTRHPEVNVGSLSDDLDEIASINDGRNDDGRALWHELGHLLGPLTRLAAMTTP